MRRVALLAVLLFWVAYGAQSLLAAEPPAESRKKCVSSKVRQKIPERGSPLPFLDLMSSSRYEFPLPQDFIEALRKHPISRWVKKYRGKKIVLAGVVQYSTFLMKGEAIQSRFLVDVFRQLFDDVEVKLFESLTVREFRAPGFPEGELHSEAYINWRLKEEIKQNAELLKRPRSEQYPDYPVVNFKVLDSAEYLPDKNLLASKEKEGRGPLDENGRPLGSFDMPFLKPANPVAASIDRREVREHFGIRPKAKVVSIYTVEREASEVLDPLSSVSPEVIFYSYNTLRNRVRLMSQVNAWAKENGFEVVTLSELRVGDLDTSSGKKFIVINDEYGKMSFVHAASDMAIVRGPINLFESLMVGTPTVVYRTPSERELAEGHYHRETFEAMLRTAFATGGAREVREDGERDRVYRETLDLGREFTRPYLVKGPDGKTPVDRLLDHIMQVLAEQGI